MKQEPSDFELLNKAVDQVPKDTKAALILKVTTSPEVGMLGAREQVGFDPKMQKSAPDLLEALL